jgi:uncharacterized lipoprotein YehR (DUF1307 family)
MRVLSLCLVAGVVVTALAGCSSKVVETQQFSGFLPDYS